MNAPVLPPAHDIAVRIALRGAWLREATKLVIQASHLDVQLMADLEQLPPRDATDLRVEISQQDSELIDALLIGTEAALRREDRNSPPQPQLQTNNHH